jgi:hypothetical protein
MKLRNWPIEELPGLSDRHLTQLKQCGITTTRTLLKNASTPEAKLTLAHQLSIHIQYVNKWVALSDLATIPTVGCQYCGLLLHAGVASVALLAQMPVHKLHHQILRVQVGMMQRKDLCPPPDLVTQWVEQAKLLVGRERRV